MYRLYVNRDDFTFSASQILIINDELEELSGHNFHITADIEATHLKTDGVIIDFRILKRFLREIVNRFNHRTIVPMKNNLLTISNNNDQCTILYKNDSISFPARFGVFIDKNNASCECLAIEIADMLTEKLKDYKISGTLEITLSESPGQGAGVRVPLSPLSDN